MQNNNATKQKYCIFPKHSEDVTNKKYYWLWIVKHKMWSPSTFICKVHLLFYDGSCNNEARDKLFLWYTYKCSVCTTLDNFPKYQANFSDIRKADIEVFQELDTKKIGVILPQDSRSTS